jgi:transcriptional regulator with XRE-family HTH domain
MEVLMPQDEDPRLYGRDGEIWRAHLHGHTQERIAADKGISQQRVSQIIRDIRASIPESSKVDAALDDLERLSLVLAGLMPAAETGDTKAAGAVLRIIERRAKALGTDATEPLSIVLERHRDLEGQLVSDALAAALDVLGLTPEQRMAALGAAQQRLLDAVDL